MKPDLTRTADRGPTTLRWGRSAMVQWAALVVAGAVLIACGGGGEGSDATGPTTVPTATVAASTAPPATLEAPPVSTEPPVTEPPGTEPPATEPPPTTLDPAALDAQIRADFERTVEVRVICGQSPADCDIGDIAVPGSPEYRGLADLMATRIEGSLAARPDSGPFSVRIESVKATGEGSAQVVACITDGLVLVDTRGTADGADDIIFDDSVGSARSKWTMRFVDRWLRFEGELLGQFPGATECG